MVGRILMFMWFLGALIPAVSKAQMLSRDFYSKAVECTDAINFFGDTSPHKRTHHGPEHFVPQRSSRVSLSHGFLQVLSGTQSSWWGRVGSPMRAH